MNILICGDREWTDGKSIRSIIDELVKQYGSFKLIVGGARGVDSLAAYIARNVYQLPVDEYPADWERFGKPAGRIRNRKMLAEGKPNLVIAVHSDLYGSKGTRHMFQISGLAKVPRVWYSESGKEYDERE